MERMMIAVCFFIFGFVACSLGDCPNSPNVAQDRRQNKSVLTIATYNVEWLFLSGSNCPGSGCTWKNYNMALEHLQHVAREIEIINPDILVLEEVNSCEVLYVLNETLSGRGYEPYLLQGTDTSTGQNVGLLTRIDPSSNLQRTSNRTAYPIQGSKCGFTGSGSTAGVSKHFYTTFNIQGLPYPVMLVGTHLLAYPDRPERCVEREAQATVLQGIIRSGLEAGYQFIVVGDLNDYDPDVPDINNDVPISQVLRILKDPLPINPGDELVNMAIKFNQATRFTSWYSNCAQPIYSMIDHILLSTPLASRMISGGIDHSYQVACETLNSDHWPVVVQIDTSSK